MARAFEVGRLFTGSAIIYVIVAACGAPDAGAPLTANEAGPSASASGGAQGTPNTGTEAGPSASGGTQGTLNTGGASGKQVADASQGPGGRGLLDALTDPVSDAMADVNASGTRLKANYYAGSDGSKQFLFSFHDTLLNQDCTFSKASDGTIRCMPASTGTAVAASVYADANCTQPIALVSQCPGTVIPTQISAMIPTQIGATSVATHVFALGAVTSASSVYWLVPTANTTTCNPGGINGYSYTCTVYPAAAWTALQTNQTAYAAGAEVVPPSPTTFVQATMQTEP